MASITEPQSGHIAEMLLEIARQGREATNVFFPFMFWMNTSDEVSLMLLRHDGPEGVVGGVREAAPMFVEAEGPPVWVAVIVDAFGMIAESLDDGTAIVAGHLDERFAEGDGRVVEQLMLFVATKDTGPDVYRQVYRWTPVDGWEWEDIELIKIPVPPDHALPNLLRTIAANSGKV